MAPLQSTLFPANYIVTGGCFWNRSTNIHHSRSTLPSNKNLIVADIEVVRFAGGEAVAYQWLAAWRALDMLPGWPAYLASGHQDRSLCVIDVLATYSNLIPLKNIFVKNFQDLKVANQFKCFLNTTCKSR